MHVTVLRSSCVYMHVSKSFLKADGGINIKMGNKYFSKSLDVFLATASMLLSTKFLSSSVTSGLKRQVSCENKDSRRIYSAQTGYLLPPPHF